MTTKYIVKFNNGTRVPGFFNTKEEAEKVAYERGSYKNLCYVASYEVYTEKEVQKMIKSL